METKKWIHYGWQTFLLCMVVSVSQPVLATSVPSSPTNKDNVRKPKTAKPQPTSSTASGKSISSSHKMTVRTQNSQKEQQTRKKDNVTAATTKETRQKLSDKCCVLPLTNEGKTPRKERSRSQQKQSVVASPGKEPSKKNIQASQRALRTQQQIAEKFRLKDSKHPRRTVTRSRHSNRRYVTILKETKQQTREKVIIAIPRTRMATRDQHRNRVELTVLKKSRTLATQTERRSTTSRQKARTLLTAMAKSVAPVVSESVQPKPTDTQSVTTSPVPLLSPVASPSPVAPLASHETTQQGKPQLATPAGGVSQDAPRPDVVTPPSLSPQTTTLAFVEPSSPKTVAPKEEQRLKDWPGYSTQKAPFAATVNDEPLGYRINSLFVLPGDEIFLEVIDSQKRAEYSVRGTLGPERLLASRRWYWTAPTSTGVYQLKVTNTRTNSAITLNVFVMVPLDRVEDGHLNGYRIGTYPTEPLRQLAMYNRPRGLIEVTQENEDILVSPHFRLRQFLCKQDGGYPKYMILNAHLLNTLEQLLEMVNARGYRARTFSIMSGYRTPYYNRAIGNRTTYSRHLWGDAADIYIDEEPRDGKMDDLNEDGVIDAHDADVIYQLIENTSESRIQKIMLGGLARYRETSSHGPFIHVDARGSYARWGVKTLTKGGTTRSQAKFPVNDNPPLPSYWKSGTSQTDLR